MPKVKLIYIMGAGRSGTTALATFLGTNNDIQVLGEMHQLFEHIHELIPCSCGKTLKKCDYWSKVLEHLPQKEFIEVNDLKNICQSVEKHTMIIHHLLNGNNFKKAKQYLPFLENIFTSCNQVNGKPVLLDSSKYISRALALRNIENIDLKVIYMVRDSRGVVNSFSKQVQTSRGTISSILYYLIVNLAAQIVCWTGLRGKYIKVRYEDMMEHPDDFFKKLEKFLGSDLKKTCELVASRGDFKTGHLIGGNRLKKNKTIKFKADVKWNLSQSRMKQFLIYICTFPIMVRGFFWS
jgi:hypothetical protein